MAILVSTVSTDVYINDIGGVLIEHPTVDFNITDSFDDEEVFNSKDLKSLVNQGLLTMKDENGVDIYANSDLESISYRSVPLNIVLTQNFSITEEANYKYYYFDPGNSHYLVDLPDSDSLQVNGKEFFIINKSKLRGTIEISELGVSTGVILRPDGFATCHCTDEEWNVYVYR